MYYFLSVLFIRQAAFTVWRNVGKGDLHEALQGQKSETGVDNQPQELPSFILKKQNTQGRKAKLA